MTEIPANADGITAAWLREATAASGALDGLTWVKAERLGEGVGMTTEIYRLMLNYAPDSRGPATLVAKLQASLPMMRDVANAYGLYEREVLFYRELASTISLRSPRCLVAAFDPASKAFVLVMEDLCDARPGDQVAGLTLDQLRVAIDQVADLHARWWNRSELPGLEDKIQPFRVPPYCDFNARHASGWETFDRFLEGRVSRELRRVGERMCDTLDGMAADMARGPRTICHGDFRADNLMFTEVDGAPGLTCVDWQLAMQARGPFDIGYMMSGSVNVDVRREHEMALLRGYHDKLLAAGVEGYSFEECLHDYRRALLIGFTYLSQSGAAADLTHPRTEALYDAGMRRIDAAVADHGLAEFVN